VTIREIAETIVWEWHGRVPHIIEKVWTEQLIVTITAALDAAYDAGKAEVLEDVQVKMPACVAPEASMVEQRRCSTCGSPFAALTYESFMTCWPCRAQAAASQPFFERRVKAAVGLSADFACSEQEVLSLVLDGHEAQQKTECGHPRACRDADYECGWCAASQPAVVRCSTCRRWMTSGEGICWACKYDGLNRCITEAHEKLLRLGADCGADGSLIVGIESLEEKLSQPAAPERAELVERIERWLKWFDTPFRGSPPTDLPTRALIADCLSALSSAPSGGNK